MIAWLRAAVSLSRSKIFRIADLPKFHVVHSYLRSDVSRMTNLQELMNEIILPKLSPILHINNDAIIGELIDLRKLKTKVKFPGTFYCEASLMALVHLFSDEKPHKSISPFSHQQTQELGSIFSVSM